jgi:hypothetical protein
MSGYQSSLAADRVAVDAAPSPPMRLRLGGADARAVARSLRRARAVLGHQFSFWVFGAWVGKIEALVSRAGAVEA